jgi:hypothetical protein
VRTLGYPGGADIVPKCFALICKARATEGSTRFATLSFVVSEVLTLAFWVIHGLGE